jgi:hypothetical protein
MARTTSGWVQGRKSGGVGANRFGLTKTVSPRFGAQPISFIKLSTVAVKLEDSYSAHLARATAILLLLSIYFSFVKKAITDGGTAETVQATAG